MMDSILPKFKIMNAVIAVVIIQINVILEIWLTEKMSINEGSPARS